MWQIKMSKLEFDIALLPLFHCIYCLNKSVNLHRVWFLSRISKIIRDYVEEVIKMSKLTVLEILSIALAMITLILLFTIAFAYVRSKFVLGYLKLKRISILF